MSVIVLDLIENQHYLFSKGAPEKLEQVSSEFELEMLQQVQFLSV